MVGEERDCGQSTRDRPRACSFVEPLGTARSGLTVFGDGIRQEHPRVVHIGETQHSVPRSCSSVAMAGPVRSARITTWGGAGRHSRSATPISRRSDAPRLDNPLIVFRRHARAIVTISPSELH